MGSIGNTTRQGDIFQDQRRGEGVVTNTSRGMVVVNTSEGVVANAIGGCTCQYYWGGGLVINTDIYQRGQLPILKGGQLPILLGGGVVVNTSGVVANTKGRVVSNTIGIGGGGCQYYQGGCQYQHIQLHSRLYTWRCIRDIRLHDSTCTYQVISMCGSAVWQHIRAVIMSCVAPMIYD